VSEEMFGVDAEFLKDCYPKGSLKGTLSDKDRHKVKSILQNYAYTRYWNDMQKAYNESCKNQE